MRAGWIELWQTFGASARATVRSLWFLVAYWLYIDGVNTIIKMAVDYGLSLGLRLEEPDRGAAHHAVRGVSGRTRVRLDRQASRAALRHPAVHRRISRA